MDFSSIGDLIGAAGAVAGGSIFGVIGSAFGLYARHKQEKQRQAWEEKKWDYEYKTLMLQKEMRREETEDEIALAATEGGWNALSESYAADAAIAQHAGPKANMIRSLFRPFATTAIWILAMVVFYWVVIDADSLVRQEAIFSKAELHELIKYMVYSIFFCASAALLWWFSDRAFLPPGMKAR